MSLANIMPSSIALASTSSGPSGTQSFLLMAARIWPSWSQVTILIPVACSWLKTAPSVLILYQELLGGDQVTWCGTMGSLILCFAIWNSSRSSVAFWIIPVQVCRALPVRAAFLLCQMLQARVIMMPKSSSPTCWTSIRCHTKSMKKSNCSPWCWIGMLEEILTSRAFGHPHNACPPVSASTPQASQVGSSMIFLLQRLVFVGKTILHALHAKDRILLGIFRRQSVLQNALMFSLFEGPPWEVDVLPEMERATL